MTLSHQDDRRQQGLSLLEVLIVVAIIGLIAGLGTSTFIGWRADTQHAEAVARLERELAVGRTDAKRRGVSVTFALVDEATAIPITGTDGARDRSVQLPYGGTLRIEEDVNLRFAGAVVAQDPYEPIRFELQTGTGISMRTSTFTVLPPLGRTAVRRTAN